MKRKLLMTVLLTLMAAAGFARNEDKVFNVLDYGARNDGSRLATTSIQKAIDDCSRHGGGVVFIPKGDYLVGTINLKSDIELRFATGARLVATTDLSRYQRHNSELAGVLYTEDADNVSITGKGVVFGQGMEFMYADSAKVISGPVLGHVRQGENFRKVHEGVGDGPLYPKDRFHQMIVFSNCTNVELRDFTCIDSPYWCFLIVHCDRVTVHNLKINNNLLIPNSDGLDIISSSNVNVSDCYISCGDDAIVTSGYDWHFGDPGFKRITRPSENINISNCILRSRSSGIRIGGWDQNVMSNYNFENITIFDSNCGVNINIRDYAGIENVNFTNLNIETRLHTGDWWGQGEPIKISAAKGTENNPGAIRNVHFTNVTCSSENSVYIYAGPGCTVENIYFTNFDFHLAQSELDDVAGGNFDLRPIIVPDKEIFASDIPVFYVENASGIILDNGTMTWDDNISQPYFTVPVEAVDVTGLTIEDVEASPSPSNPGGGLLKTKRCRNVKNGMSLANAGNTADADFVRVEGGRFFIGDRPYSYVGTNFWYGAILGSKGEGGDRARLLKELDLMKKNGIDNLRILVGGDGENGIPSHIRPTLQTAPGEYNDEILDGLDFLLMEMGKRDMYAVLYLNNSWEWSGGYSQYLEWAGAGKAPVPSVDGWNTFTEYVQGFVRNERAKELFADHVEYILTRTNRYTGCRYTDDPTIMSWQIGNEPRAFSESNKDSFARWTASVARLIKSIDNNHLVSVGGEGKAGCEGDIALFEIIHSVPDIDYMTIHIWPKNWGWINETTLASNLDRAIANTREYIDEHLAVAGKWGKPLVLEEFGFPRDGLCFRPGSPVSSRDRYYEAVFSYVLDNADNGGGFAGCNFWGWGGFAEPSQEHVFWQLGDDYTGDPAQEEQGLNSVFAVDITTLEIIGKYSSMIRDKHE